MRTGRAVLRVVTLTACALAPACAPEPAPPTPGEPLTGLTEGELGRFLLGRAVFERLATEEEGLGPLYNAERCSACHDQPASGGDGDVAVRKATRFADGACDLMEAEGGDNFQLRATAALVAHGLGPEVVPRDATAEESVRAPSLFGLGLVEAIPEETLRGLADPDDRDGNGVSGRLGTSVDGRPGRFGRKAETPTIDDFVEGALRFELGFTTPDHPAEEGRNGLPIPDGVDPMADPEIDRRGIELLGDYVRFLAPPAPEPPTSTEDIARVREGTRVFARAGCADCHTPELRSGPHRVAALSRKPVRLYSDLLLHDLGPELAGVCGPGALPTEHRTARLWGLRHRSRYLHDGRAPTIEAAIEFHGGEASRARDAFRGLGAEERAALLAFLRTL